MRSKELRKKKVTTQEPSRESVLSYRAEEEEGVMDPFPPWMEKLWNAWDIRVFVLLSLTLQVVLFIFGSRRKYTSVIWVRIIVWSAYLMADWVATVALGKLSDITAMADSSSKNSDYREQHGDSPSRDDALRTLWAPLLLVHLGGPDTITAYSMEDNQLWLRHLLGLAVQVGVVTYIFLRSWTDQYWILILPLPMFVAGIIKYGERIWVLWSTNNEQPRKFNLEDYVNVRLSVDIENAVKCLLAGYISFQLFKPHIANYVCSEEEMILVAELLEVDCKSNAYASQLMEYKAGFMYDVLYTKAVVIYNKVGFILRLVSFSCTVSVLIGFSIIAKDGFSDPDVFITYVLLVGALVLDVYAVTLAIYSDWAVIWMLKNHKIPLMTRILGVLAPLLLKKWKRRRSKSMAQFNLLSFCLGERRPTKITGRLFNRVLESFGVDEKYKEYMGQTRVDVPAELEEFVFEQIEKLRGQLKDHFQLFTKRGEWALERLGKKGLAWSVQVDFNRSIIVWHIATDICHYLDPVRKNAPEREIIKHVSNYMMYLLLEHPYMLSVTAGKFMFRQICDDVKAFFQKNPDFQVDEAKACGMLREIVYSKSSLDEEVALSWRGPLIKDAIKLARQLVREKDKWKMIGEVWIEMMFYAAARCLQYHHAQQLRRGGEFLTHVWLLLTTYGFTERSQRVHSQKEWHSTIP